jgi:hypothetical protein
MDRLAKVVLIGEVSSELVGQLRVAKEKGLALRALPLLKGFQVVGEDRVELLFGRRLTDRCVTHRCLLRRVPRCCPRHLPAQAG